MAASPQAASQAVDHGFHELRVARVIEETADAKSFVLDVPDDFTYRAGQFVTFRVGRDGDTYLRCYSMSSCPDVDDEFKVTVKRVPGGAVSNWMNDHLEAGDTVEVTRSAGVFLLPPGDADIVAFAGGSGITPVISILKQARATSSRNTHLLYANRDRDSIIFGTELDAMGVDVAHHLDVEHGFVTADDVRPLVQPGTEYFICGPAPFMDVVEAALLAEGVDPARIHIERFTPGDAPAAEDTPADGVKVTIELDGKAVTADYHPGASILQTARQAGLPAPSSCEAGSCATCMGRLLKGAVTMRVNNALTDEEVADGWILTCQSLPTTPEVHVVYEYV
jgi:3-ketosteroid 9alpha-monooxygenase subunit B